MFVAILIPFLFLQLSNFGRKLCLQETPFRVWKTKISEHVATAEFDILVASSRFGRLGVFRFMNHRFEVEFNTRRLGILE